MEEDMFQENNLRQTVDPRLDMVNKTTLSIYKDAVTEFGFKLPLAFMLYNQIRFYEDFGKLHVGMSVVSKETLADQFGVTVKQIDRAYNNLTTKYKLGKWIDHEEPVFRNVKRTWVSNKRLKKGQDNYYSVVPELLQRSSFTTTVEYLPTDKRPLSESKKKVSESKEVLRTSAKADKRMPVINDLFDYWSTKNGYQITSKVQANRNACSNLYKKYGADKLMQLIDGVSLAQQDKYAPRISDFIELQAKLNQLISWGKTKAFNKGTIKV